MSNNRSIRRQMKKAALDNLPVLGEKKTVDGLYAAGNCPECDLPVFYHGAHEMDPKIYTCCGRDCSHTMDLKIPPDYSPNLERVSCNMLFRLIDLLQKGRDPGATDGMAEEEPATGDDEGEGQAGSGA